MATDEPEIAPTVSFRPKSLDLRDQVGFSGRGEDDASRPHQNFPWSDRKPPPGAGARPTVVPREIGKGSDARPIGIAVDRIVVE